VVLYELLTQRRPFACDWTGELERAICETEPERPSNLVPAVPGWLDKVCMRCLEKDPACRYPSAAALADDLQRNLTKPPGRWATARALGVVAAICGPPVLAFTLASSVWPALDSASERYRRDTLALLYQLRRERHGDLIAPREQEPRASWIAGHGGIKWVKDSAPSGNGIEDSARNGSGIKVDAVELSLIELLPEMPFENYRLTVVLRQDNAYDRFSDVGVYFLHESDTTPDGPRHLFALARFAEVGEAVRKFKGPRGQLGCMFDLQSLFVGVPSWPYPANKKSKVGSIHFVPQDARPFPGSWHTLTVEVRRAEVRVSWDREFTSMDLACESEKMADWLKTKNPSMERRSNWQFRRNGAVGIYLYKSMATVQRFEVESLADP
jgi:hypothetical protein